MPEFQRAYVIFLRELSAALPVTPSQCAVAPDTATHEEALARAWNAALRTFNDKEKAASFYWRANVVLPLTQHKRYRNYVSDHATLHVALLSAVCVVPGNPTSPSKQLRMRLNTAFRNLRGAVAIDAQYRRDH